MRIKRYLKKKWGAMFRKCHGNCYAVIYLGHATDRIVLKRKRNLIWKNVNKKFPRQIKYLRGNQYCLTGENYISFQLTGITNYNDLRRHEIENAEMDVYDETPDVKMLVNECGIFWISKADVAFKIVHFGDPDEWNEYVRVILYISKYETIDKDAVKGILINNNDLLSPISLTWFICVLGGSL